MTYLAFIVLVCYAMGVFLPGSSFKQRADIAWDHPKPYISLTGFFATIALAIGVLVSG